MNGPAVMFCVVRAERQAVRIFQATAARRDERIDEGPGRAVVAQHLVRTRAAHVEIAVGSEGERPRCVQATASGSHERVDEDAGLAVVPQHFV